MDNSGPKNGEAGKQGSLRPVPRQPRSRRWEGISQYVPHTIDALPRAGEGLIGDGGRRSII